MSYTALYRKWRPQKFEDVRGQDHIVKTLKNQLKSGRVGHAYLFSGTRGTGKTTVAKILARAVNCENPLDGSPCNECPACRAILSGNSVNVSEIDAASNNGVDNIREIREEVKYRPTEGRYKVYIIDEVHMLSAGAFNALLKTLEEPPEYVIFILATTEIHKIPITVLSRCQRYDFRRLSLKELENQVGDLLSKEGVDAEEEAVSYIARKADGSSRDALSLMEQCISLFYGEKLTYEKVLDVLGAADQEVFSRLLRMILACDVRGTIGLIDDLLSTGRELTQFVTDFTWYLRNIMLVQTENPREDVLGVSRENLLLMKEEAANMDINQVMRYIRILGVLTNEMRYAPAKRVLLEIALIKMMQPAMEEDLSAVLDRIRALEERSGLPVRAEEEAKEPERPVRVQMKPQREIEVTEAQMEDYKRLSADWPAFVESLGRLTRSVFTGTKIGVSEDAGLTVLFRDKFNYTVAAEQDKLSEIRKKLSEKYEKEFRVILKLLEADEQPLKPVLTSRIPGIEMEIEEE